MSAYHETVEWEMDINCSSGNVSRAGNKSDEDSVTNLDKWSAIIFSAPFYREFLSRILVGVRSIELNGL